MQSTGGASLSDAANITGAEPRPGAAGPRLGGFLALALSVVAIDQATKYWAVTDLAGRPPVEVLGPVMTLRYVRNPGAAFGLGGGATVLLSCVAVLVVAVILRVSRQLRSPVWAVGLGLLLGGALGNLLDRIFRQPGFLRGEVVDFLALPRWPVFNAADMAIVCAAVLLGVASLRGIPLCGEAKRSPPHG